MQVKPLPGNTSATGPPLTDVTTLGSSAALLLPQLVGQDEAGGWRPEPQLDCPRLLEDVEEVNRILVKPLPGKTSATGPPITDVTGLGSLAAQPLP